MYCDSKALRSKLFTDEWYTVLADESTEEAVDKEKWQPWLEFHVQDFATFGEMLSLGI